MAGALALFLFQGQGGLLAGVGAASGVAALFCGSQTMARKEADD
jgi:hypothetical protein